MPASPHPSQNSVLPLPREGGAMILYKLNFYFQNIACMSVYPGIVILLTALARACPERSEGSGFVLLYNTVWKEGTTACR